MIDEIGRKIRDLRKSAELTQGELALRSGLTDGFISQIERGLTSISIDSLKQILDALNVSLADFFSEGPREQVVFTSDNQVELDEGGTGKLLLLVPGATNREMEPAILKLAPGEATSLRSSFNGDNYGYVLRGRIQLQYGSEIYRIKAEQSFYFTADREHKISNPGRGHAAVLWITSPPYF
ncbi:MAG TPA: helix-turn-helix domain-containing protein [Bacteroidetes bacterium]|nr:helix-turn-helix domain-containing protein [Bacteroidota bacterium]